MSRCFRRWLGVGVCLAVMLTGQVAAAGRPNVKQMTQEGVEYLKSKAPHGQVGETALIGLALAKAGVPASDAALAACVQKVLSRFQSESYSPERQGGAGLYETSFTAMFLAAVNRERYLPQLAVLARHFLALQNANGSWDYHPARQNGDTSITQCVLLALWEINRAGVPIPLDCWSRCAEWHLAAQHPAGGYPYHPDEFANPTKEWHRRLRLSVTAGALGSMRICQTRLPARKAEEPSEPSPIRIRQPEGQPRSADLTEPLAQAEAKGRIWLSRVLWIRADAMAPKAAAKNIEQGPAYYWLYSLERLGGLTGERKLGGLDWYDWGCRFLAREQKKDGSWQGEHVGNSGAVVGTGFAVLFLTRSTMQSKRKPSKAPESTLGGGTLIGGRGMPKDVYASGDPMTRGQTPPTGWVRPYTSPKKGTAESLMKDLGGDLKEDDLEAVLAGLMERVDEQGAAAIADHLDKLKKLATDRSSPMRRRAALWLMSRSDDLYFVPMLIDALADRNAKVYRTAREGLRQMSRRAGGYGLGDKPTPEQVEEAQAKWRAWYEKVRPDVPMGAPIP